MHERAAVLADDQRDVLAGFDPKRPRVAGRAAAPLPKPSSRNPLAFFVKKVVRKLTAWQIDPIVHQLNAVHRAAAREVAHDRDETGRARRRGDQRSR